MKRTALFATLLTFLAGLLVLAAGLVFLFQARQMLLSQVERLEQERSALEVTVARLESDLADRDIVLEAAEANVRVLTAQLEALEQEVTDLAAELEETSEALEEARSVWEQPPTVVIFSPENEATIRPGQPVELVVSASHPSGVVTLNLTANGESIGSFAADDQPLFTLSESWTPAVTGTVVISATAVNVDGRASQPVTTTIQIVDAAASNADLREQIEANVIALRRLEPLEPIEPTLLTTDELRARLEADFAEDFSEEDSRHDALALSAFDFIEPDFDLHNFLIDLYSEQIAGFYDPKTAEFVVISEEGALGALEQWTYAHEFVHALQDQHFPLGLINDESLDSEARLALRSLAEGEATLVQLLYLDYMDQEQLREIFAGLDQVETGTLDSAPPILRSSLQFPYTAGFDFVRTLYQRGGFAAIDAAWNNLPQSSEHILHPDRYLAGDAPIAVTLAPLTNTLGAGWQLIDEEIFGEFYLREYLSQHLRTTEVDTAATGWGGDRYAVYWHEEDEALVMVMQLVWDTPTDSDEFATAYTNFASRRFGNDGQGQPDGGRCWQGDTVICFYQSSDQTLIVRAPDLQTARTVAAVQRAP